MSSAMFYALGCKYTYHNIKKSKCVGTRRFKSFFGVSPLVCSITWKMIYSKLPSEATPKHLLWSLCFLKQYASEHTRHLIFQTDEKTIRKWTWIFVDALANLDVVINIYLLFIYLFFNIQLIFLQIFWEKRFKNCVPGQTCFVSLDGVDFKICEPSPFDKKWYSHKFSGPGIKYEIGLCIRSGEIVWKHGGYPCGQFPDLKLARQAYVFCVNEGEKTLADKGYKDSKKFILKNDDNKIFHQRIMARHETVNKRINQFCALKYRFRHDIKKHPKVFHAIINLTQLMIQNGEPLFSVF